MSKLQDFFESEGFHVFSYSGRDMFGTFSIGRMFLLKNFRLEKFQAKLSNNA